MRERHRGGCARGGAGPRNDPIAEAVTPGDALDRDRQFGDLAPRGAVPFGGKRMGRNSDQSFWGIGIPSIFSILSTQGHDGPAVRNNLGWWWHTPDDLLDKIDPELLERDTRIYRRLLSELLCRPVLPLDPAAQLQSLRHEIEQIPLQPHHDLDLGDFLLDIAALTEIATSLSGRDPQSAEEAGRIDRALMALSRVLVPLDYTSGDRFAHDPALAQPSWPSLEPIRRFVAEPTTSVNWHSYRVEARRALNRVASAITRHVLTDNTV